MAVISLRKLDLNDAGELMGWLSDADLAQFCFWEPCTDNSDVIDYINNYVRHHPWLRAICIDGRAVGAISVSKNATARDRCRGEMEYFLESSYWGRGIGTAAVKLATERVFVERPELKRVEALVEVENLASIRVLEKVGFKREAIIKEYGFIKGRFRDFVMFGLLPTDLESNSAILEI